MDGTVLINGSTYKLYTFIVGICIEVCMYVCIDIKSLPHIAWRLQLRSVSWGVINKLNMRVGFETLCSSQSQKKISNIFTGSTD